MAEKRKGSRQPLPAIASASHLPTKGTIHRMKRLLSYSEESEQANIENEGQSARIQPEKSEADNRSVENMVKCALTELLNEEEVKNNPEANKSIQDLLMATEKEWRKQRRDSVHDKFEEDRIELY